MVYFFPQLPRLFARDYRPSQQDILRARGKTTGITETCFISKERVVRLFDVGGQRSERKKWCVVFRET
jgi:guanine nucleotide-binding protein subunit alpha